MDHITQLKTIRADAIARLRNSSDYKLAGKLGALIIELGHSVDEPNDFAGALSLSPRKPMAPVSSSFLSTPSRPLAAESEPIVKPTTEPLSDLTEDNMIDELVAEMESDKVLNIKKPASESEIKAASSVPFLKSGSDESSTKYAAGQKI